MLSITRPAVLRRAVIAALLLALCIPLLVPASALADPIIHTFHIPGAQGPEGLVKGPDGNMWVAQETSNQIAKVTPGGVTLNNYTVPTAGAGPLDITAGYDGQLWFTEYGIGANRPGKLGRISTAGVFSEINLGRPMRLWGVTKGPDGNMWFTEFDQGKIGRIGPNGDPLTLVEFEIAPGLPPNSFPSEITVGSDGNLWFSEEGDGKIGRITPTGQITEFDIPTPGSGPCGIALGADGNIWFAEQDGHKIGRITPTGQITEFIPPTPNSGPIEMTSGPDGNVWFAEGLVGKVARVNMKGLIVEYTVGAPTDVPYGVAVGPDGNIWFTQQQTDVVGYIDLSTIYTHKTYLPLVQK